MTRDELITKKFPHSLFGYDIAAVDKYLDEIIQELDRLHAELDGLKRELSGSTAESVIAEADIIEAAERERRLAPKEPEKPDESYGSFLAEDDDTNDPGGWIGQDEDGTAAIDTGI